MISRKFLGAFLLGTLVLARCSQQESPIQKTRRTIITEEKKHKVVARVNGIPIVINDSRPLKEVIQEELLAQVAASSEKNLLLSAEVIDAARRSLGRRLIATEFSPQFKLENVPDAIVEQAYKLNEVRYNHPEMVEVQHIIAVMDHARANRDELIAAAKVAQQVHAIAISGALDVKGFSEIAEFIKKESNGIEVRTEHLTTPLRGFTVDEFADAAFKLKKKGDISPVVETKYGFHVIYYIGRIAAENIPLSTVKNEIRQKVFEQARAQNFLHYLASLEQKYKVALFPEALPSSSGGPTP